MYARSFIFTSLFVANASITVYHEVGINMSSICKDTMFSIHFKVTSERSVRVGGFVNKRSILNNDGQKVVVVVVVIVT